MSRKVPLGSATITFIDGQRRSQPLTVPKDSTVQLGERTIHLNGGQHVVYWTEAWTLNGTQQQPPQLFAPKTRQEAFTELVTELGFNPHHVTQGVHITDSHEHGTPKLHLSLIVPITHEQADKIRNAR